ncbi:MAG: hypothetical protein COA42_03880 [Alteromonadaceae bacterium]|nr:MAG: hypothetical protein COA42_03880 [Alteromonadaceae bacterium]
MFTLLVPSIWYLIYAKSNELNPAEIEAEEDLPEMSTKLAIFWFILGLVVLILSAKTLVWGGKEIAQLAGISELIIGLTVIAIGTSLPELAASMASALKGHHDIALGNIIGSNIFNLLAVLSLPGLIHPPIMGDEIFYRDFAFMLLSTLALAAFIFFALKTKAKGDSPEPTPAPAIGRVAGILLLCLYLSYMYILAAEQLA